MTLKPTDYLQRGLQTRLSAALEDTPVVGILGPRQCGKTTFAIHQDPERKYVSLDNFEYLQLALDDPQGFVSELPDRVTIDEVQRAPELTRAIKLSVDFNRRPGRFILTGSANLLQLPLLADSLAGRMECLYLQPFSESEKEAASGGFLRAWLDGKITPALTGSKAPTRSDLPMRLVQGGYPEACKRPADRAQMWLLQYVESVIERDVRDVAQVRDGSDLVKLMRLLAERTASLVNISELATSLGRARQTIESHLSILEKLFLIRRLSAWHQNATKRAVKTSKIHICDSGLAAALSHLHPDNWVDERSRFGRLLESFIVQQLVTQGSWADPRLRFWHYRDKDMHEVDCAITRGPDVWGVEVKLAQSVGAGDAKGLQRLARYAGARFKAGIVFYEGRDVLPLGDKRLMAVPISKLWEL